MSDTARVQRWRQRQREDGKEPMTIWLSHDEKLRLADLALQWHCSPSTLVQQALAQYHPGSPAVPGMVTDTERLRALVAEIVAALLAQDLPARVRDVMQELQPALPQSPAVTVTNGNVTETTPDQTPTAEYAAALGHDLLTEPVPGPRKGGRPRSPIGQQILALLAAHPEGLTAEQLRGYLSPRKPIGDTLSGMKRLGTVRTEGQGRTLRYHLPEAPPRVLTPMHSNLEPHRRKNP